MGNSCFKFKKLEIIVPEIIGISEELVQKLQQGLVKLESSKVLFSEVLEIIPEVIEVPELIKVLEELLPGIPELIKVIEEII